MPKVGCFDVEAVMLFSILTVDFGSRAPGARAFFFAASFPIIGKFPDFMVFMFCLVSPHGYFEVS